VIDVLIADDHPIVREGLKQIVADASDIAIKGEASDGDKVLEKVRGGGWDVLVLDLTMPGLSGLDLIKQLRIEFPKLPILVLSMHPEDQYAVRLLRAGASGYLTKDAAADQLVAAIRKVVGGGRYVSPTLAEKLVFDLTAKTDGPIHEALSNREFQVLCLIASGRTVTEIAEELVLSVKTISTYRSRILGKMDMSSNAELTRYAIRNNLVT
jgi:two-component system invasion response regulator UvrY